MLLEYKQRKEMQSPKLKSKKYSKNKNTVLNFKDNFDVISLFSPNS